MTGNYGTTTYLVDLEGGLSQVLSDGTNEYLYGNGRIAQTSAEGTQYFLGDALGSVRQLADAGGAVSLAKGYDPFGNASWNAGSTQTPYGYTGEQTDVNGMVYLRARFYSTEAGRFVSKDTWSGNYNQPLSLNGWNYVEGNPINERDPSGRCQMTSTEPCTPGENGAPTPDPYADFPTREPAHVIWSPSVNVHELLLRKPNGDLVPPGTTYSQVYVKDNNGNYLTGACGPLSALSVSMWYDPQGSITNAINSGLNVNYVGVEGLISFIRTLPFMDAYPDNYKTKETAAFGLRKALSHHHFPIPGVKISNSSGIVGKGPVGHWLVVTGLSMDDQWVKGEKYQWVRVFNPFNNQKEYYMWSWFNNAWGGGNDFSSVKQMVVMCSTIPFMGEPNSTCVDAK